MDSTHPDFWTSRYSSRETPWDLGKVPLALKSFLAQESSKGHVLIPGCGSGYEVVAFLEAGHDVLAIDFSPSAIERSRTVLGPLVKRVRLADFFKEDLGKFDIIYERTFLCSMPPDRWPHYVKRVAELLAEQGRLVGTFFYGSSSGGPPFPISEARAMELFSPTFKLERSEMVTDSLPIFGDGERWQEWRKI